MRLIEVRVAAEPDAWQAVGVPLDDDGVGWLGSVVLRVDPAFGRPGLRSWVLEVASDATIDDVDGLPTEVGSPPPSSPPTVEGGLGVTGIDHVVVVTPDLDRTVLAVETRLGLRLLRIRDGEAAGAPVRQAFFRLGEVILEVVAGGPPEPGAGRGRARFYGLALTVSDLEEAARRLGDRLGPVKPAVQRDRSIATVRREAALGTAVALMSPAPDRR
jgi:catechol 2,3-dioxygenase-like lactoylglutathione lyase family enzyme